MPGSYVTYTLPSNFTFYGVSYSKIYISPTGAIFFSTATAGNAALAGSPSLANLEATPMIAPFWAPVDTRFVANDGIYANTSRRRDYVTIRFAATPTNGSSRTGCQFRRAPWHPMAASCSNMAPISTALPR